MCETCIGWLKKRKKYICHIIKWHRKNRLFCGLKNKRQFGIRQNKQLLCSQLPNKETERQFVANEPKGYSVNLVGCNFL